MGSLISLKNVIIFSAVLLAIGSVSAQQAFAGTNCESDSDGNWNNSSNWNNCNGGTPNGTTSAVIDFNNIIITGDEEIRRLIVQEESTLFIDCDASLNLFAGGSLGDGSNVTNHGTFNSVPFFLVGFGGNFFNSGTVSGVVATEGAIVQISTKCTQPIGGTVGSMSTTSLLIAGAQANIGWWSIAMIGAVAIGAGIVFKVKSNKTNKETL